MTRLTNEMRNSILAAAVKNLPKRDFHAEGRAVIEATIYREAPPEVRVLMDDDRLRLALAKTGILIKSGNKTLMSFCRDTGFRGVVDERTGSRYDISIHMDVIDGNRGIATAICNDLEKSGVIRAFVEQRDLLDGVKGRLRKALYSVTTVKRLREILEPELHHLIPEDAAGNLPVASVRVADDLRALGALEGGTA